MTIFSSKSSDSAIWEEQTLKFDETKAIRDMHLEGPHLTVLLDKNELLVVDLRSKAIVLRATYKDATGKVCRAFYIDQKRVFPKRG